MPCAAACFGVRVHILHHVPNIQHAVRAAPIAELLGKIPLVQAGDNIHIGQPEFGRQPRPQVKPQSGDKRKRRLAEFFFQRGKKLIPPGVGIIPVAKGRHRVLRVIVAKAGLI